MNKATTQSIRAEAIARLLLKGMTRRQVHEWCDRQGWRVSIRTIDRLIKRAQGMLAREVGQHMDLKAELQKSVTRLESLFRAALEKRELCGIDKDGEVVTRPKPDIRTALMCQRELNVLLGLDRVRPNPEEKDTDDIIDFGIVGAKEE